METIVKSTQPTNVEEKNVASEAKQDQVTYLDSETRIRMMTPTFSMRGIDDAPVVELKSDPGFHIEGEAQAEPELVRADMVLTGICVNCAQRTDCKLTHPENVIWHCEEYY
ncbi:hypothetical protein KQI63_07875 [bacterium]|nr:hypothetical protein [bacterium]